MLEERLTVFHAGDTVGMVLTPDGEVRTLTRLHESRDGISRYFGMGSALRIDVECTLVEDGDMVLLMSDGVTKAFSNEEAAALVWQISSKTEDLGRVTHELVFQSRTRGSLDDITVVMAELSLD